MRKIAETLFRAHSFNMVTLGSPIGNQSIFLKSPWQNTKWNWRFPLSVSCLPILESTYPSLTSLNSCFSMHTNPFAILFLNILSLNVLLSLMQLQTAFPMNVFLLTLLNSLKVVFVLIISWFLLGWDLIHTLNHSMLFISYIGLCKAFRLGKWTYDVDLIAFFHISTQGLFTVCDSSSHKAS